MKWDPASDDACGAQEGRRDASAMVGGELEARREPARRLLTENRGLASTETQAGAGGEWSMLVCGDSWPPTLMWESPSGAPACLPVTMPPPL